MKGLMILFVLLIFFAQISVSAQNLAESDWENIRKAVLEEFDPVDTNRDDYYGDDATLEFTLANGTDVYVSIDSYNSPDIAAKKATSYVSAVAIFSILKDIEHGAEDTSDQIVKGWEATLPFWDQAYVDKVPNGGNHFIVVRKRSTTIILISEDFEILLKLEKLMKESLEAWSD